MLAAPTRSRARHAARGLLRRLLAGMRLPRVLLAEDDEALRALLVLSLSEAGYDVIETGNGVELLCWLDSAARLRPHQRGFDLVVTDLRMPGLDGLQVLQRLGGGRRAPRVLLISAFADDALRAEARALGATTVLAKPFALAEFVAAVRALLPVRAA